MIRVGIVDDDAMVRTGLSFILKGRDDVALAWQAADGREALDRLHAEAVDVLLLDIRMPGMDGLTTLSALKELPTRPKTVVLTTFSTDDYVIRALKLGAEGFLLKDADPNDLVDAIRRVHRGEPSLSSAVTSTLIALATEAPAGNRPARDVVRALSERERQVAALMAQGLTNGQIASRLGTSPASVKSQLSSVFTKFGVDNRVSAALVMRDAGF